MLSLSGGASGLTLACLPFSAFRSRHSKPRALVYLLASSSRRSASSNCLHTHYLGHVIAAARFSRGCLSLSCLRPQHCLRPDTKGGSGFVVVLQELEKQRGKTHSVRARRGATCTTCSSSCTTFSLHMSHTCTRPVHVRGSWFLQMTRLVSASFPNKCIPACDGKSAGTILPPDRPPRTPQRPRVRTTHGMSC